MDQFANLFLNRAIDPEIRDILRPWGGNYNTFAKSLAEAMWMEAHRKRFETENPRDMGSLEKAFDEELKNFGGVPFVAATTSKKLYITEVQADIKNICNIVSAAVGINHIVLVNMINGIAEQGAGDLTIYRFSSSDSFCCRFEAGIDNENNRATTWWLIAEEKSHKLSVIFVGGKREKVRYVKRYIYWNMTNTQNLRNMVAWYDTYIANNPVKLPPNSA